MLNSELVLGITPEGQQKKEISRGNFNAFCNFLSTLFKYTKLLKIKIIDSKIIHIFKYKSGYLTASFNELLGKNISLEISSLLLKRLKSLDQGEKVFMTEDKSNRCYIFENSCGASITIPQPADYSGTSETFTFNKENELNLNREQYKKIKLAIAKSAYIDLLIHQGQIIFARSANSERHTLNPELASEYRNIPPDLVLRSYYFLKIPGQKASIRLALKDGQYILKTDIELGKKMIVTFFEKLLTI